MVFGISSAKLKKESYRPFDKEGHEFSEVTTRKANRGLRASQKANGKVLSGSSKILDARSPKKATRKAKKQDPSEIVDESKAEGINFVGQQLPFFFEDGNDGATVQNSEILNEYTGASDPVSHFGGTFEPELLIIEHHDSFVEFFLGPPAISSKPKKATGALDEREEMVRPRGPEYHHQAGKKMNNTFAAARNLLPSRSTLRKATLFQQDTEESSDTSDSGQNEPLRGRPKEAVKEEELHQLDFVPLLLKECSSITLASNLENSNFSVGASQKGTEGGTTTQFFESSRSTKNDTTLSRQDTEDSSTGQKATLQPSDNSILQCLAQEGPAAQLFGFLAKWFNSFRAGSALEDSSTVQKATLQPSDNSTLQCLAQEGPAAQLFGFFAKLFNSSRAGSDLEESSTVQKAILQPNDNSILQCLAREGPTTQPFGFLAKLFNSFRAGSVLEESSTVQKPTLQPSDNSVLLRLAHEGPDTQPHPFGFLAKLFHCSRAGSVLEYSSTVQKPILQPSDNLVFLCVAQEGPAAQPFGFLARFYNSPPVRSFLDSSFPTKVSLAQATKTIQDEKDRYDLVFLDFCCLNFDKADFYDTESESVSTSGSRTEDSDKSQDIPTNGRRTEDADKSKDMPPTILRYFGSFLLSDGSFLEPPQLEKAVSLGSHESFSVKSRYSRLENKNDKDSSVGVQNNSLDDQVQELSADTSRNLLDTSVAEALPSSVTFISLEPIEAIEVQCDAEPAVNSSDVVLRPEFQDVVLFQTDDQNHKELTQSNMDSGSHVTFRPEIQDVVSVHSDKENHEHLLKSTLDSSVKETQNAQSSRSRTMDNVSVQKHIEASSGFSDRHTATLQINNNLVVRSRTQ